MSADALPGWELGKELGSGHFAKVRLCTNQASGQVAAVKIIKKPKGSKLAIIKSEVDILKSIDHPYIVKCFEAVDSPDKMYLVMEIMKGGELFDRIVDKGHFTEGDAVDVTAKLLSAMKYLHDKGIAHRDLKPENLLMTDDSETAEVKITDFGLSKVFDEQSQVMQTPCGTPGYIAPEVLLMKGYDKQCDIWSLGVIVYILLCGFPPFYADNDAQLFEKIKKGEYEFLRPYWDPISDSAKDFIRTMLQVDPKKRVTCDQAMAHPWLKDGVDKLKVSLPTLIPEMKATLAKRRMKAAFLAVQASERMSSSK
jgi:calcium/calmodulin-dependent protein kinase I